MSERLADSETLRPLESLAYALGRPQASAVIKREFADFLVDEELAFVPTGEGEHVFLQVRKTDASTIDVARQLSAITNVAPADIGYSGMKDRRGETTQWFSVKLPETKQGALAALNDDRFQVLTVARNARKLRIGSHARNHFRLRLRGCQGEPCEYERRLEALSTQGVPNYFGAQRFGAQMSNLQQVSSLLRQVLDDPLSVKRGSRIRRGMLYSAARSYLFNQVLSARIERGDWAEYIDGDVMSLDGSGRLFCVSEAQPWDESLAQRLQAQDIHPTGPLPGAISVKDKYVSTGKAADIEKTVLESLRWMVDGLSAFGLEAGRRPLRFAVGNLQWRWEDGAEGSTEGKDLCLDFTLPRGAYATSLLRELCHLREK